VNSSIHLLFFRKCKKTQQSSLGNTINIAGNNRYLATSLLLQTEKYLDGSSDASQVAAAINNLQSNIIALRSGRIISGVDIRPLPSDLSEFVSSLSF
jgi:hypothetical protein